MHAIESVAKFMELGGQTVPDDVDWGIDAREVDDFVERIHEEFNELFESYAVGWEYNEPFVDVPEAVDAAIDIAYVAFTIAVRLAGKKKAIEAWEEVATANLSKVDGSLGPVQRNASGKIMKPEGFVHPDVERILTR